jgi:alpha-maltose-1-phosphate synthase
MKVLLLTNEYPPHTYGGAGVHVEYLSRELARLMDVNVRCFGDQADRRDNLTVEGLGIDKTGWKCPKSLEGIFGALNRNLQANALGSDAEVVHCHTWYSHFGGILAKLNYGMPLVVTVHSLEPLRPWKREQLGHGYNFTLWVEKTAMEMADAIIAVSEGTRNDVLKHFNVDPRKIKIIYNGIDSEEYRVVESTATLERYGIDPKKPYLLFVGRITRQKGIIYLARAIKYMDPDFQIVLVAGAPDTPEIAAEMKTEVESARASREGIFWIDDMVDRKSIIELYSHAAVFCCPSIYEPFGIINLEAMACRTPVVGSDVGGIPEVVVHNETGYLVPVAQMKESPFTPLFPENFAKDLAHQVNRLMQDPEKRERFGRAGRQRALENFSWRAIARQARDLYADLLNSRPTFEA